MLKGSRIKAHLLGAKEKGCVTSRLSCKPPHALSVGGRVTSSVLHSGTQFYTEFGEEGRVT